MSSGDVGPRRVVGHAAPIAGRGDGARNAPPQAHRRAVAPASGSVGARDGRGAEPEWLFAGPLHRLSAEGLVTEVEDYPETIRGRVIAVQLGDDGRYARVTLAPKEAT